MMESLVYDTYADMEERASMDVPLARLRVRKSNA